MNAAVNIAGVTGQLVFANIKTMTIPCLFVHYDEDDSWGCWSDEKLVGCINTYGLGQTLDEAIDDFIDGLKKIALSYWDEGRIPENISLSFILKVLVSSGEGLKSCLAGRICDDF